MKNAFLINIFILSFAGITFAQPEAPGTFQLTIYAVENNNDNLHPTGAFCFIVLGEDRRDGFIDEDGYFIRYFRDPIAETEWTSFVEEIPGWMWDFPPNGYLRTSIYGDKTTHKHTFECNW